MDAHGVAFHMQLRRPSFRVDVPILNVTLTYVGGGLEDCVFVALMFLKAWDKGSRVLLRWSYWQP